MSPDEVSEKRTVVGLGELLWDLLPNGKQLGGAPANFAYITKLLGDEGIVASRIGDDPLGSEAMWRLSELRLGTESIQQDRGHATGSVKVEVDTGQPPTKSQNRSHGTSSNGHLAGTRWRSKQTLPVLVRLSARPRAGQPSGSLCIPLARAQSGYLM
jgi:hypothetical protein